MASLVVSIKGRELKRVPIEKPTITIGRDASCDVTIDNIAVSRLHATVVFDGKGFSIEDAGSSNGIFINGKRASQRAKLNVGDEIMVLKHTVKLIAEGGHDTTTARFTGVGDHTRDRHRPEGIRKPQPNKPQLSTMRMSEGDVGKLISQIAQAKAQSQQTVEVEQEDNSKTMTIVAVAAVLCVLLGLVAIGFFATG